MEDSLSVIAREVTDGDYALRDYRALACEGDFSDTSEREVMTLHHAAGGLHGVWCELHPIPRRRQFDTDVGQRGSIEELGTRPHQLPRGVGWGDGDVRIDSLQAVAVTGRAGYVDD